jgi:hypothetical protein
MLNAKALATLPPDVRMLYESGVRLQTNDLLYAVQFHIRTLRQRTRVRAVDSLFDRLIEFGNDGGWMRAKSAELAQEIFRTDKGAPTGGMVGEWRSIEFECIFNDRAAVDTFVLEIRKAGLTRVTTVKGDGSVARSDSDRNGVPHEVVFSYCRGNEESVRKFCAILQPRAYVNKTCGTHVHFDMRGKSEADVKLMGGRMARYVPLLKRMLPESRRTNQYCRDSINGLGERGSRYSFVNMHAYGRHQTIEIRGHSGTISADKILNWIAVCETIMSKRTRATKDVTNCAELADLYEMPENIKAYMVKRESDFSAATMDEQEDRYARAA